MTNNFLIKSFLFSLTAFIFINNPLQAQSFEKVDSLVNEMCKTVILLSNKNEAKGIKTTREDIVTQLQEKHFVLYFKGMSANKVDSLLNVIGYRMQRNCEEFGVLVHEESDNQGEWVVHTDRPKQKLNRKSCKDFYKIKQYYYKESNGDRVDLEIKNGYWIDHFKDGTYSKLKVSKGKSCDFEIEFIESNNEMRKNFSKKGDIYRYSILDSKGGFYELSVEIPQQSIFYTFKMYYEE